MATSKLIKHITFGDVSCDIPNGFPLIVKLTTYQYSEGTPNLESDITGYDNISYRDTFSNSTLTYSDFIIEVQKNRPVLLNWDFALSGGDTHLTIPLNSQTLNNKPTLKYEYKGLISNIPSDTLVTAATYKSWNCTISFDCTGANPVFKYKNIEYITNKPIIIKTAVISGDPAINTIYTLTISESVDISTRVSIASNQLFTKGTEGRRLVVYIQGAGGTLIPCELLPVYSTDYTTPALFSGFTGIKFRGSDRTNYYGFYVKLASDGTLTATVEDRQVYS